jgi:hypothetical protein
MYFCMACSTKTPAVLLLFAGADSSSDVVGARSWAKMFDCNAAKSLLAVEALPLVAAWLEASLFELAAVEVVLVAAVWAELLRRERSDDKESEPEPPGTLCNWVVRADSKAACSSSFTEPLAFALILPREAPPALLLPWA